MSDQWYRSAIDAAIEEPGVDFKAAMSWSKASACARFELLKDIAAMCCYGGDLIIIGRNDEDKKTGSLSEEQAASFETTKVNEFARQYLRPLPPLRVVSLEHGEDRLAILDVPGFAEIPPCFQKDSQCPNRAHLDRRMHFRQGDVFIRTPASQTTRLCDPEDWRVIWSQVQRNIRQSVSFSSAADETDDETEDPYTAEYEEEEQNFRLPFGVVNTMGILELEVRPETYIKDRVPRGRLREVLRSARATAVTQSAGKTIATPYEQTELRNTLSGIMLVRNSLETASSSQGSCARVVF